MSEFDSDVIRKGFWINHSRGRILGATITTDTTSATVLVAFVAVLVTVGCGHLWNLILFTLHQSRAGRMNGDGVFQQEQVALRSLPPPGSVLTDLAKIVLSWRGQRAGHSVPRTLCTMVAALAYALASLAAGVFSSNLVDTSNLQVLVKDQNCFSNIDVTGMGSDESNMQVDLVSTTLSYAENCYGKQNHPSTCEAFVQSNIPMQKLEVSCPPQSKSHCTGKNPQAIVLDSGLLDSNDVFGINEPLENRVLFRRRTTYFPITVENYITILNTTEIAPNYNTRKPLPGEEMFALNFGARTPAAHLEGDNTTFRYSTYLSNVTRQYTLISVVGYDVPAPGFLPGFYPIPELSTPGADPAVCMIFSNAMLSETPIDDPVFSSHRKYYCSSSVCSDTNSSLPHTYFYPDQPVGVVGAMQQYQICLVNSTGHASQCTDLRGNMQGYISDLLPLANSMQAHTMNFLANISFCFDLSMLVIEPVTAVRASKSVVGQTQYGLPDDQWVTEATGWEALVWSTMQYMVANHTVGYFESKSEAAVIRPRGETEARFCRSQKVLKTGGFANINVFGLSFVVAMTGLFMTLDIALLKFVIHLSRTRRTLAPRVDRWIQDGVFQLQRRAYEAAGFTPWKRLSEEIPIFDGQEKLPTLVQTTAVRV